MSTSYNGIRFEMVSSNKSIVYDSNSFVKLFRKFENFWSKTLFLISPSLDHYYEHNLPQRRIILVTLLKVLALINGLRYILYVLYPTPELRALTANAMHYLCNPMLMSLALFGPVVVCDLMIGGATNYWEWKSTYFCLEYLYRIKHNKTGYQLSGRYYDRYYKALQLMAK